MRGFGVYVGRHLRSQFVEWRLRTARDMNVPGRHDEWCCVRDLKHDNLSTTFCFAHVDLSLRRVLAHAGKKRCGICHTVFEHTQKNKVVCGLWPGNC